MSDDLDIYVAEAMKNPEFRAASEDATVTHGVLDALLARRRALGLSQKQVGKAMGVKQPTVSQFESEPSDPRLSTLHRYARAVGARVVVTVEDGIVRETAAERLVRRLDEISADEHARRIEESRHMTTAEKIARQREEISERARRAAARYHEAAQTEETT